MNEEILKILTHLFALLSKHGGEKLERKQAYLKEFFQSKSSDSEVSNYLDLYFKHLNSHKPSPSKKQSDVQDAIQLLFLCNRINNVLDFKQKVVIIVEMLEYLAFGESCTSAQVLFTQTASKALKFSDRTFEVLKCFILLTDSPDDDFPELVEVTSSTDPAPSTQSILVNELNGHCFFLHLKETNIFLFRMFGDNDLLINDQQIEKKTSYFFTEGSELKFPTGEQVFFSDVIKITNKSLEVERIHFEVKDVTFQFKNSTFGRYKINISENEGKMVGIMGASGSGKTTLLNLFSGNIKPDKGSVCINGIDINLNETKGVIGYIGQDDILLENLTVYQNLFYNSQLCFRYKTNDEIDRLVLNMLESLDLTRIKDLDVGNLQNKKISGGQRKRLNIALELIREPQILFVDEPTSGLSSQDSKNVMRLLKELTVKGKLIFTVIHQPSSETFQSFDEIVLLDVGGIPIFYGSPLDSLTYFKSYNKTHFSNNSRCTSCGRINTEEIFEIVESKTIDEFGRETNIRKRTPSEWNDLFYSNSENIKKIKSKAKKHTNLPKSNLHIQSKIQQVLIFFKRDLLSKWKNTQYMLLNLLEAPILAIVLAVLLRDKNNSDSTAYAYGLNDNIPAFILVSVIVALFMGLSISAQEIIKDEKIRKRERFLNLSKHSYLISKLMVLFILSAIQTATFVLIANTVLEIDHMFCQYWLMLFSISCAANIIGLNISNTFKNIITVYIAIPLILIPQLILSGALFDFEKLNQNISEHGKTPFVADLMISRWAYEGIAVWQDKENNYNKQFYPIDKEISKANYYKNYWLKEIKKLQNVKGEEKLIANELNKFNKEYGLNITINTIKDINPFLMERMNLYSNAKDRLLLKTQENSPGRLHLYKDKFVNNKLHLTVKNLNAEQRILKSDHELIQNIDAIYQEIPTENIFEWRAPFFVAYKNFLGIKLHTYWFNLLIIWLFSITLYFVLYLNIFKRMILLFKTSK